MQQRAAILFAMKLLFLIFSGLNFCPFDKIKHIWCMKCNYCSCNSTNILFGPLLGLTGCMGVTIWYNVAMMEAVFGNMLEGFTLSALLLSLHPSLKLNHIKSPDFLYYRIPSSARHRPCKIAWDDCWSEFQSHVTQLLCFLWFCFFVT